MKSIHVSFLTCAIAIAISSAAVQAQKDTAAGYGRHFIPTFSNEVGANNLMLGVQELGGKLYCTGRGNGATTTQPHTVVVRKLDGTKITEFSQGTATSTSAWGYRDGATDGKSLMFGFEGGINVMSTTGVPVTSVIATAGVQTIVNPINSTGLTSTHRGLAYDPDGNGGKGSIFVGNFGATVEEIALDGTVLKAFPNTSTAIWSVYGMAIDPNGGGTNKKTIWMNSAPNAGDLVEYDLATFVPTGNKISRALTGSSQGGLSGFSGRDPNNEKVTFGLIGMDQGTPDSITGYRIDTYPGLAGETEVQLLGEVAGGGLTNTGLQMVSVGQTIGFALDQDLNVAALYFIDAGSPVTNATYGATLAELRRTGLLQIPTIVNKSVSKITGTVPTGTLVGLQFAVQALYIEPKGDSYVAGINATNQIIFEIK